jgi:hypothetical protein
MKFTTRILVLIFVLLMAGLLSSNMILKKQYDAMDKSDIYWTYDKVLEQPFKYLNITGGNGTNIYYEPSAKPSVRLLQEWVLYHHGEVKASVRNDTLFLNFDYNPASPFEKAWLRVNTPLRIFSPELLSVTGNNTHFEMQKVKQKSINVNLTGKSQFEVESMSKTMDTVNIYQRDSSAIVFEISPEYLTNVVTDNTRIGFSANNITQTNRNESMSINSVNADIGGHCLLDIGHAQIQSLQLHIQDSSAIILSGGALKKFNNVSSNNKLQ